jgi:microcystin-dependent protein
MQDGFMGTIQYFGCNFNPYGFQLCAGQIVSIQQYTALFSLLGTNFGGNGTSNFGLPDLRGRSMIGQSPSLVIGEQAGKETAPGLTMNTMPNHTHAGNAQIGCNTSSGTTASPLGAVPAADTARAVMYDTPATAGVTMGTALPITVGNAGTTAPTPFSILAPYQALTAAIAMVGVFPTRS